MGSLYKYGICGHFGNGFELLNGQTIKTKIVTEELEKALGKDQILKVDSHNWKSNPLRLVIKCYLLVKRCENVVVLPAHNGVKVFIPLFLILNMIFHKRLHYVLIGGWLPQLLKSNAWLIKKVSSFNGVYVETNSVIENLNKLGINNTYLLTNFKRLQILCENYLNFDICTPHKLCTFSRVTDMKGIEDAVEVVKRINENTGDIVYSLDIYGPIDQDYQIRFNTIKEAFPDYIQYKGSIGFNDSVDTLRNYFLLLFPTRYQTEGIPGTIIDAYAAGLPVVASEWNSAREIVTDNETGYVYKFMSNEELEGCLLRIMKDPNAVISMKPNCLRKAKQYSPETVIEKFIKDTIQ